MRYASGGLTGPVHAKCVALNVCPSPLIHIKDSLELGQRQVHRCVAPRGGFKVNIFSWNCPGAITGFSCRAPEKNSPKIVSCMGPCPVRAPPVIAPGALTGFSGRAPENNSKIIFPACNHFESEGKFRKFDLLSNFCPGIFLLPRANSRGVEFLRFYSVLIFVPPTEKLPSLPGTEIPIFCLFCLLWP